MQLLSEHSKQNAEPKPDYLNQFGKTVTLAAIDDWLNQLRS